MPPALTFSFRCNALEKRILEQLKKRLGLNRSGVMHHALARLAQAEGLLLDAAQSREPGGEKVR